MSSLEEIGPSLPSVARQAVQYWLSEGKWLQVSKPDAPAAPVFVTLRDPDKALRGCIGTLAPTTPDVVGETARAAVLAATQDPRFPPLTHAELQGLGIEVSVLLPEEPIQGLSQLDPACYGVIVRGRDGRRGVLLPDIPGIETASAQVAIARKKAGLSDDEPCDLARFRVLKFG